LHDVGQDSLNGHFEDFAKADCQSLVEIETRDLPHGVRVLGEALLVDGVEDVKLDESLHSEPLNYPGHRVSSSSNQLLVLSLTEDLEVVFKELSRLIIKESGKLRNDLANRLPYKLGGSV
jgi:hypothetical protein